MLKCLLFPEEFTMFLGKIDLAHIFLHRQKHNKMDNNLREKENITYSLSV